MRVLSSFVQRAERSLQQLQHWLAAKTPRERYMVIACSIFVLVSLIGFSLWQMHQLASAQQKRLNQLKDLTVWMQTNAVTLQPSSTSNLPLQEQVQRAAQQQGLAVATQGGEDQLQLVAENPNYAVLADFLTQLAQMGLSIEKMEIVNNNNQLKLTASVR